MSNKVDRKILFDSPQVKLAIERIERYRGKTLSEIAEDLKIPWNSPLASKGAGGLIGELILGLSNNALRLPDIQDVEVEVKYLPIYLDKSIPKEPTQITMIDYFGLTKEIWETASIRKKIARVFWVGYAVSRKSERWVQTGYRILGWHLEIMPERDLEVCGRDWQDIQGLVSSGRTEDLSCSMGTFIEPKTKGRDSNDRRAAPGLEGRQIMARRRAFYFKKAYTKTRIVPSILEQAQQPLSGPGRISS
jgi:DNA mismatch repair endonuclease MutH